METKECRHCKQPIHRDARRCQHCQGMQGWVSDQKDPLEVQDNVLILKRKERKSLLSLGGIASGRRVGTGSEWEYTKKAVARKIAKEGR